MINYYYVFIHRLKDQKDWTMPVNCQMVKNFMYMYYGER